MIFTELKLKGAYLIEPERVRDERGFFARAWCQREFTAHGLNPLLVQCNLSFNEKKGTIRGLHYQIAPYEEVKLITCLQGAIYDVILDLRPDSATYLKWQAVDLTAENLQSLYVPEGFAHGFQTLADKSEVYYLMSEFYKPEYARGVRWNDPIFGIEWPIEVKIISSKDISYCDFNCL